MNKKINGNNLYEETHHAAMELALYACNAEIIGGISHNREVIRKWIDIIYELNDEISKQKIDQMDMSIVDMEYMRNTMHRLGLSCDESIESFSANFETEFPRLLRSVNKLLDTL